MDIRNFKEITNALPAFEVGIRKERGKGRGDSINRMKLGSTNTSTSRRISMRSWNLIASSQHFQQQRELLTDHRKTKPSHTFIIFYHHSERICCFSLLLEIKIRNFQIYTSHAVPLYKRSKLTLRSKLAHCGFKKIMAYS